MQTFSEHLLLENRVDFLKVKYLEKARAHILKLRPELVHNGVTDDHAGFWLSNIIGIDPTPNKMYAEWCIRQALIPGTRFWEDQLAVKDDLAVFHRVKQRLTVENRDINHFKNYHDLRVAMSYFVQDEIKSSRQIKKEEIARIKKDIKVVYDGPEGAIYIPKTIEASCLLGRGTQWCTAATTSHNFFGSYNSQGPLHCIFTKADNRKYQFHFESQQLMDERDIPVDPVTFKAKYPWVFKKIRFSSETVFNALVDNNHVDLLFIDISNYPSTQSMANYVFTDGDGQYFLQGIIKQLPDNHPVFAIIADQVTRAIANYKFEFEPSQMLSHHQDRDLWPDGYYQLKSRTHMKIMEIANILLRRHSNKGYPAIETAYAYLLDRIDKQIKVEFWDKNKNHVWIDFGNTEYLAEKRIVANFPAYVTYTQRYLKDVISNMTVEELFVRNRAMHFMNLLKNTWGI